MISCYETAINYNIVCLFKNSLSLPEYIIIVYNQELTQLKNATLANADGELDHFYKCIHFFEETGVFAYFSNTSNFTILFKS